MSIVMKEGVNFVDLNDISNYNKKEKKIIKKVVNEGANKIDLHSNSSFYEDDKIENRKLLLKKGQDEIDLNVAKQKFVDKGRYVLKHGQNKINLNQYFHQKKPKSHIARNFNVKLPGINSKDIVKFPKTKQKILLNQGLNKIELEKFSKFSKLKVPPKNEKFELNQGRNKIDLKNILDFISTLKKFKVLENKNGTLSLNGNLILNEGRNVIDLYNISKYF